MESNITRYFIYIALKGLAIGLFMAIWVIYLQERRGMTLAQAALVDTTFFVVAAIGEIPTGIVSDRIGRRKSLIVGISLQATGMICWTFAPTVPLIMLSYVLMGIGTTFLSGTEDAFFYESVQLAGRGGDYNRLAGKSYAMFMGTLAMGNLSGGLLATIDLILPYMFSILSISLALFITLSFQESQLQKPSDGETLKSSREILRQALILLRVRPALRYPLLYMSLIPLAPIMMEAVFLQPQAIALGVPLAAVGAVVMVAQMMNMAGANWSEHLKQQGGEAILIYGSPLVMICCLCVLAVFQVLPALVFIPVMGFLNAALRPILLSKIQNQVADEVRATLLSIQSFLFTCYGTVTQPTLGFIADHAGFPTVYLVMAGLWGGSLLVLIWFSRGYFPSAMQIQVSSP